MKKYISNDILEQKYINNLVLKHEDKINLIESTLSNFKNEELKNEIFFEGQIYDAYSLLLKILDLSKENIMIIDNYVDKELLDLLSKTNKKITVYTKNINKDLIKKYQLQYNNIEILENNSFHDRFIIIDNKKLYHSGASFKDIGKKCFEINKIDNKELVQNLINYLK